MRAAMSAINKGKGCCVDARMGCLIAGIIISVIHGIVICVIIGGILFMTIAHPNHVKQPFHGPLTSEKLLIMANNPLLSTFFMAMLDFSFAVVLCHGALKRKAGLLKACFIYQSVKCVKWLILSLVLFMLTWDLLTGFIGFIVCGLYAMLIYMVNAAYKSIKNAQNGCKCNNDAVETKGELEAVKYQYQLLHK